TILITCPDCKKQLRGPAEILGKRVRCKSCGHTFVVKSMPSPTSAAPQAPPVKAQATPTAEEEKQTYDFAKTYVAGPPPKAPAAPQPVKSTPSPSPQADEKPYTMTDVLQTARRCPQCAAEMEEGDVVCLECGYNTETRVRHSTLKTYETTAGEWTAWL